VINSALLILQIRSFMSLISFSRQTRTDPRSQRGKPRSQLDKSRLGLDNWIMAACAHIEGTALERVSVDVEKCRNLADLIRARQIPSDHEDSNLIGMSPRQIGNFYLLLVAICHQTSPVGRPPLEGMLGKRHLRGWDYLSAKLEAAVHDDEEILTPHYWRDITADKLRQLFRDETFGDGLSDISGRALLIADLGKKMLKRGWEWADQLHADAKGYVAGGANNLVRLLSYFRAYDDPVHSQSQTGRFASLHRN